jgi:hypothetical protein
MAQAAALLLQASGEGERQLSLAGFEGIECDRAPSAGDRLEIEVRLEARFGAVLRVAAVVRSEGEAIARGSLLLAAS